jgi:hypothetical protein
MKKFCILLFVLFVSDFMIGQTVELPVLRKTGGMPLMEAFQIELLLGSWILQTFQFSNSLIYSRPENFTCTFCWAPGKIIFTFN